MRWSPIKKNNTKCVYFTIKHVHFSQRMDDIRTVCEIIDKIRNEYVPVLCAGGLVPTPGWDADLTPEMCALDFPYVCERVTFLLSYFSCERGAVGIYPLDHVTRATVRDAARHTATEMHVLYRLPLSRRNEIHDEFDWMYTIQSATELRVRRWVGIDDVLVREVDQCRVDAMVGPRHGKYGLQWMHALTARIRDVTARVNRLSK